MRRRSPRPFRWHNWARNQTAVPRHHVVAHTEDDLVAAVSRGVAERATVRVLGSGHSFTDIACTDGILVDITALSGILAIDRARNQVTVGAGTVLGDLNRALRAEGLALPNLGDIQAQTMAGATATGTHGTGAGFQCISAGIVGARIVTADGGIIDVDRAHRPDLLAATSVSLGALGMITQLTFQCVPAFNLHTIEDTLDIDENLEGFDEVAATTDHAEFYWFPGTRTAHRKRNRRTNDPPDPRSRRDRLVQDELVSNVAFGILCRLGRRRPEVIGPTLRRMMPPGQRVEYTAASYDVFCSPRRVRFVEMEYAVPRAELLDAFGRVRALVEELAAPISFPIEVRVLGRDDLPLSMASGRDSGFIAVHVEAGSSHEAYFSAVEAIMAEHQGRPHWGKLHRRAAGDLAALYPGWQAFQQARAELDPDGHFTNPYLDRVLGPR